MAGPADDLPISPEELTAALASRDLASLVARLARERSWGALTALFRHAAGPRAPAALGVGELEVAARALALTLDALP
ncbi:MAG TPA: hypothetical protein VHJ20_18185, partial [Polyangia bacterium]|nr:hypothetical protein [Polyangia bacterium]